MPKKQKATAKDESTKTRNKKREMPNTKARNKKRASG